MMTMHNPPHPGEILRDDVLPALAVISSTQWELSMTFRKTVLTLAITSLFALGGGVG
jgi:plasmid maintenance system antidote protein VapI